MMHTDRKRDSMLGTLFFAIGVLALVGFVAWPEARLWLTLLAIVFLVPGVVLLYRVGRQL